MKFHPFIFIETNFKRTTQAVWLLAVMEGRRRIDVPKKVWKLPLKKQIPLIQGAVRQDYAKTEGVIQVWGEITEYRYYYKEKKCLVFDTDGEFLGKSKEPVTSQATLTIGGRGLTMSDRE